jgi:hypothetical protein
LRAPRPGVGIAHIHPRGTVIGDQIAAQFKDVCKRFDELAQRRLVADLAVGDHCAHGVAAVAKVAAINPVAHTRLN